MLLQDKQNAEHNYQQAALRVQDLERGRGIGDSDVEMTDVDETRLTNVLTGEWEHRQGHEQRIIEADVQIQRLLRERELMQLALADSSDAITNLVSILQKAERLRLTGRIATNSCIDCICRCGKRCRTGKILYHALHCLIHLHIERGTQKEGG
jgi:hypothetical protein